MYKIAIIGSRSITDYQKFNLAFNNNVSFNLFISINTIISGGAIGIDTLAKQFANNYGLNYLEFLPNYEKYGQKAPLIRNKLIVESCDGVFAFWDGKSRGTIHTVKIAEKMDKPVKLIKML
jgi:predicted Rossmann fold nucleotide-binding protein DprA/Smf involved in DNA uptake